MLKFTLFTILSMGLGFLDLGCSETHKVIVLNNSDTSCILEVKMLKRHSTKTFMNEFGFDSADGKGSAFLIAHADSSRTIYWEWPLIKKEKIKFDEQTQTVQIVLDPKKQIMLDTRKYSNMETQVSMIHVVVPGRNQEILMRGETIRLFSEKHEDSNNDYIIQCQ